MIEAFKTNYDTLTTSPRPFVRDSEYYLLKWKRRKGLLHTKGGGRLEKFRRIAKFQRVSIPDILEGVLPRVALTEYHFVRWNVGPVLCVYCNETLTKDSMTQDHVIPRCRGGSQIGIVLDGRIVLEDLQALRDNLEPSCEPCNREKGDQPLLMFLFSRRG
jgi:5-methylcytosine-specific restriction endonuclease McrA